MPNIASELSPSIEVTYHLFKPANHKKHVCVIPPEFLFLQQGARHPDKQTGLASKFFATTVIVCQAPKYFNKFTLIKLVRIGRGHQEIVGRGKHCFFKNSKTTRIQLGNAWEVRFNLNGHLLKSCGCMEVQNRR